LQVSNLQQLLVHNVFIPEFKIFLSNKHLTQNIKEVEAVIASLQLAIGSCQMKINSFQHQ
jgi:hypothetical protein